MNFLKKLMGVTQKRGLTTYRRGIQCFNRLEYEAAIQAFELVLSEKKLAHSLEANLAKFYCGRAYINVGITQFAKNNSATALVYFQNAQKFNPQDTDLHYFIGICLNNIGQYKDAMDSFSKILETEPWNVPTKLKIATIFHNMKMWKNAEDVHRAILKKHPNFADVHYHLGLSLMSQNKSEDAAKCFSNALDINPDYTQARLKLAMVDICMGQMDKAKDNLTFILNRYPEYADVHYLMALIKEDDGDLTGAAFHLSQALEISPQFKNALVKKIIIHCKSGNQKAAQEQIDKALEYYPQDRRISTIQKALKVFEPGFIQTKDEHTAISLEDESLIKELKNEFHKDLDIMPNVSEIIAMFNNPKYIENDTSLTNFLIPFITEQINRNPTYPDLYNSLGTQLLSAGKHLEAENAFSKALELNPDYVTARVNLMKNLYHSQRYQEALEHGDKLLKRRLHFPDVYLTVSDIQFNLGLYEDAMVNLQQVLKLRPKMSKVKLRMAKILKGQQRIEEATKMLKTFLKETTDLNAKNEAERMLITLLPDTKDRGKR